MTSRLAAMTTKLAVLPTDGAALSTGSVAAVAAILRETPHSDGPELFFIRRAEHPTDPWSGHIAFPGGRYEPSDENLLETAIRETREEVGIDLTRERLLGRLPDVSAFSRTKKSDLVITPYVFAVGSEIDIVVNEEVAGTLWVPIAALEHPDAQRSFTLDYDGQSYELPCTFLEPGNHRLWGITHRMVEMLLDVTR